jgi:hypothetical protein
VRQNDPKIVRHSTYVLLLNDEWLQLCWSTSYSIDGLLVARTSVDHMVLIREAAIIEQCSVDIAVLFEC